MVATLNVIRWRIGNQWSDLNTGVMCSLRLVPVTSLAAAFCTDWRRWSWVSAMPYSRELQ